MNALSVSTKGTEENLLSFEFGGRVIKVGDLWKYRQRDGKQRIFIIVQINFDEAYFYTTISNIVTKLPVIVGLELKTKSYREIGILENPAKWALLK